MIALITITGIINNFFLINIKANITATKYEMEPDAVTRKREPLHDWSSHAADAFRYLAINLREKQERPTVGPTRPKLRPMTGGNLSWMGA